MDIRKEYLMNESLNAHPRLVQHQMRIRIDNLKCGGCATSIEMGLLAIHGVLKAHVIEETDEVDVTFENGVNPSIIKDKLKQLGYPEAGTTEGLEKLTTNVRSYVSCARGKLNKKEDQKN